MADQTVTVTLIAGVSGLVTAGMVEVVKALGSRKPRQAVKVESETSLVTRAQAYAEQMEGDASAARERANQAWQRANAAERKAHVVSQEVEEVKYNLATISRYLLWLLELIGEPSMDIIRLRREIEDRRPPVKVGGQQ